MSFENGVRNITLPAAGDLSAKQYHFVKTNTSGQADYCQTAGIRATGVLQNDPSGSGQAASVGIDGITKITAGGVITAGDLIATKNNGRAQTATTGNVVLGVALETSTADGNIIAMLYAPGHIV